MILWKTQSQSNEPVDEYDSDEIEENVSYPVWEVDDVDVEVVVVPQNLRQKKVTAA